MNMRLFPSFRRNMMGMAAWWSRTVPISHPDDDSYPTFQSPHVPGLPGVMVGPDSPDFEIPDTIEFATLTEVGPDAGDVRRLHSQA